MNRKFSFAPGEYYHLYSRGVDRRQIFMDERDRQRFLLLLFTTNKESPFHLSDLPNWQGATLTEIAQKDLGDSLVDIGSYCFMPNHFHLLVREKGEDIPQIPQFMKKLLTGYSMYFNIKYHRTGSLFEGHFKAQSIIDDRHLEYLYAYIHLNPMKIADPKNWEQKIIPDPPKALQFLENYHYSSFLDYRGRDREEKLIINMPAFPEYFTTPKDFTDYIKDWSEYEAV